LLEKSPLKSIGPFFAGNILKYKTFISVDDVEETNLSEYDGSPPTNSGDLCIDLRNSGSVQKKRSNSGLSPAKFSI